MSTAQDHKALVNVFGAEGSGGSPKSSALASIFDLISANRLNKSSNALSSAQTIPELRLAIKEGREAKEFGQGVGKAVDVAEVAGGLNAISNVTGGRMPSVGGAAVSAALSMNPTLAMASMAGNLVNTVTPGDFDPINTTLAKTGDLINKYLPGGKSLNRLATNIGQAISSIPGMDAVSNVTGGLAKVPDNILVDIPKALWASFGDKAKAAAKSSREFALNDMFEEYAKNDPYSTPPGGWVRSRTVPGGYGERQYNEVIPFQAETKDLWEEYKNTDSYKTVLTAQRGIRDLEEIEGQEALKKLDREQAIRKLTDPVQNIVPIKTYVEDQRGTHYRDEYGTYDVETGEKLPDPYDDVRTPPPMLLEDVVPPTADPYEAPVAPVMEQIYRQPKPVETIPTARSDEPDPFRRVRPEEIITPRIMTPRRIRPQRETTAYEPFSSPEWQALDFSTPAVKPSYSKAQMAAMLGFNAPRRTASQYMALDSPAPRPKHNLRELPTGLNASSYKG